MIPARAALSRLLPLVLAVACSAGGSSGPGSNSNPPPSDGSDTVRIALNDLGNGTYRGFRGGLYPDGSNNVPGAHKAAGLSRAKSIRSLDANGNPSPTGKYVLLSIGMSNTAQEFCGGNTTINCSSETFMGRAAADLTVNKSTLVIVNGAQGGRDAKEWISPSAPTFDEVRDQRLSRLGVTERQVQVVWLKQADIGPTRRLPSSDADAYVLEGLLGSIVRALKARYPNLQQVFITSRTYAGYAASTLNPEPYAYESGFAVKWLIQAQIDQMQRGSVADARAGDLNYDTVAPWIAWGPYPWADGMKARSDGLQWTSADFGSDGTHPSAAGRAKVGAMLLAFFRNSEWTTCWFIAGASC